MALARSVHHLLCAVTQEVRFWPYLSYLWQLTPCRKVTRVWLLHDTAKGNAPTSRAEPSLWVRVQTCRSRHRALAPCGPHRGRDATSTQLSSNPRLSALALGVPHAGSPPRVPTKTGSSPTPPALSSSGGTSVVLLGPKWIHRTGFPVDFGSSGAARCIQCSKNPRRLFHQCCFESPSLDVSPLPWDPGAGQGVSTSSDTCL